MAGKTYRDLLSEKAFLRVKERADKLGGVNLVSIDFNDFELRFRMRSADKPNVYYTELVRFSDLSADTVIKSGGSLGQVLRNAGIKVYCSCPAFEYWYAYKAYRGGYGIYSEGRYPKIRNPRLQGYICKHLYAVLRIYPFWSQRIAKEFRLHYTDKQQKEIANAIEDALRRMVVV